MSSSDINVFSQFEENFLKTVSDFSTAASSALIPELGKVVACGLVIYLIVYGWLIASGRVRGSIGEAVLLAAKIGLVCFLGLNAGNFASYVIPTTGAFQDMLLNAASGALGAKISTPWESLDTLWRTFFEAWKDITAKIAGLSWLDAAAMILALFVVGTVMAVISVLFTFSGAGVLLINQVALIVVMGFGPFFISCLLFPPIKSWFDGWLKSLVTFSMTLVITGTVISLFSMVFESTIDDINMALTPAKIVLSDLVRPVMVFCVLALIGATFVKQIPTITAALTGGMNMNSVGLGQMLHGANQTIRAVAGGLGMGAGAALGSSALGNASRVMLGSQGLGAAGALPMAAVGYAAAGAARLTGTVAQAGGEKLMSAVTSPLNSMSQAYSGLSSNPYEEQAAANAKAAAEMVREKQQSSGNPLNRVSDAYSGLGSKPNEK